MKPNYYPYFLELKLKIEQKEYQKYELLPSEKQLMEYFDTSRYAIRKILRQLVSIGYIQPIQGKGVQVIYTPNHSKKFQLGGMESFKEFAERNHAEYRTFVKVFAEIVVDEKIHELTSFPLNSEAYYILRYRYLNEKVLIIDENYYLKQVVPNLTKEIAENSIYDYIENQLQLKIDNIQRQISIEKALDEDVSILQIKDINCIFKIRSHSYSEKGDLFEYTESKHHPDYFVFNDQITNRI